MQVRTQRAHRHGAKTKRRRKSQGHTASDGCLDESIKLLVSTDGQLQVAGSDTATRRTGSAVNAQRDRHAPNFCERLQAKPSSSKLAHRFTRRSRDALPASSSTSAHRYSQIAAMYTADVAPTRPWRATRFFKCLWIRPTGNWRRTRVKRQHFHCSALPMHARSTRQAEYTRRQYSMDEKDKRGNERRFFFT